MVRNNIANIANELSRQYADDLEGREWKIIDLYNAILNYCMVTNTVHRPRKNSYVIDDGCLYINDNFFERIASYRPGQAFSEEGYYLEGLILARQEIS